MRLTTKSTFATNILLDLALHAQEGPVSLQSVAHRHGVSQSYLEGLFASLKQAGLVSSVRGPGGYVLGQALGAISLADISRAVEPNVDDQARAADDPASALTAQLYQTYSQQLVQSLEAICLRDATAGLKPA